MLHSNTLATIPQELLPRYVYEEHLLIKKFGMNIFMVDIIFLFLPFLTSLSLSIYIYIYVQKDIHGHKSSK